MRLQFCRVGFQDRRGHALCGHRRRILEADCLPHLRSGWPDPSLQSFQRQSLDLVALARPNCGVELFLLLPFKEIIFLNESFDAACRRKYFRNFGSEFLGIVRA